MTTIKTYVQENKERFISELIELLKIPSISADPNYKKDILKTADSIKTSLIDAGCNNVEICETPGNPIVYGEHIIDNKLPTVLVYGHYDVQPADPIELWDLRLLSLLLKRLIFILREQFLHVDLVMIKGNYICM